MDRDSLIERLIIHQLEKLGIGQHSRRFLQVVEREFRGFGSMSDAQLACELERRGLAPEGGASEPPDYADDADSEDGDTSSLVRELRGSDDEWAPSWG